jgi:hypothetical protein
LRLDVYERRLRQRHHAFMAARGLSPRQWEAGRRWLAGKNNATFGVLKSWRDYALRRVPSVHAEAMRWDARRRRVPDTRVLYYPIPRWRLF